MSNTQREKNPFKYSDSNKRYHTFEYDARRRFGGRVVKIPLDAGFTCPNIDGKCGVGGCIYCSGRGSGDFAAPATLSIAAQYEKQREELARKWSTARCIPYFQAHTNTYATPDALRALFFEALTLPAAVGLSIATRADCLPDEVLDLFAELSERTALTVELGLQTVHDETARFINRGHTFIEFLAGYERLRARVPKARIGVHLILGLPNESEEMMLESVRQVAALVPDEVKLHLLYVVAGTRLADLYLAGDYTPLSRENYVSLVVRALELLPPETVIGRLTGDGAASELLAPLWSRRKREVLNEIDKMLYRADSYQGKYYRPK